MIYVSCNVCGSNCLFILFVTFCFQHHCVISFQLLHVQKHKHTPAAKTQSKLHFNGSWHLMIDYQKFDWCNSERNITAGIWRSYSPLLNLIRPWVWSSFNLLPLCSHVKNPLDRSSIVFVHGFERLTTSLYVWLPPIAFFLPRFDSLSCKTDVRCGACPAMRRCKVMPLWWHQHFSSGESKRSSLFQTINAWHSLSLHLPLTSEHWLFICFIYIAAFMSFH